MQPKSKPGLLAESNCTIKDADLDQLIRRDQQITDNYQLEKDCFARGKFAQVRRIVHRKSSRVYAAKSIKRRRPRYGDVTDEILHEIRVLLTAQRCERIVQLYEVYETPTEFILVLELAEGGELQQILDEEDCIEEQICRRLLREIVEGVRYLHRNQIAHLDIKPQNILLSRPLPDGEVKLCDFGISRTIQDKCEIREIMGTTDYMPPEILQYEPISLSSDVWSIGIVAYVLLSGHSPFGGDDKVHTYSNITSGDLDFPSPIFDDVSEQAKDFIRRCLVREPTERMTCDECLAHEWLQPLPSKTTPTINSELVPQVLTSNGHTETSLPPEEQRTNHGDQVGDDDEEECPTITISLPRSPKKFILEGSNAEGREKNSSCDSRNSGHQTPEILMDTGHSSCSSQAYDSDKENVLEKEVVLMDPNGTTSVTLLNFDKSAAQLSNLAASNVATFHIKSHKRLSSDIFPNSEHQKWIEIVSAGHAGSPLLGHMKKYTSESAMSTIDMNGSAAELAAPTRNMFLNESPPKNQSESSPTVTKGAVVEIPIVVENSSSSSATNQEPSPPSTPNKKIYLSIDDSFCHFGSETSSKLFSKFMYPIHSPLSPTLGGSPNRVRSVSVERLNTCLRGSLDHGSSASTTSDQMNPATAPVYAHFQYASSSSTTISSSGSSTSTSLSSLVATSSTTVYSKSAAASHSLQKSHHQSSEVSSPGF